MNQDKKAASFVISSTCRSVPRFALLVAAIISVAASAIRAQVPETVVATVHVGNSPFGLAVTPDSQTVYVADYGSSTVSVIDASLNAVIATIGVTAGPSQVAITPDGTTVFVITFQNISVISTATNSVVNMISPGPSFATGLAVTPDGTQLYVSNFGTGHNDGALSIIDVTTLQIINTIQIGGAGLGVAITADGKSAYVGNGSDLVVMDVASQTIVQPQFGLGIIRAAEGLVISPDAKTLYALGGFGDILALNAVTGKLRKDIVIFPQSGRRREFALGGVQLSPNGKLLYVTEFGQRAVTTVNRKSGLQVGSPISVRHEPGPMAVAPSGRYLYVGNAASNSVSVIELR